MRNKIITASFIAILTMSGCTSSNSNATKDPINAYIVESNERWKNANEVDSSSSLALDLYFLNNPYQFKDNSVLLYLGDKVIYKGEFKNKLRVYVPQNIFGKRVIPGMTIYDKRIEYNFIQKVSIFLPVGDQFLYVVFCPQNDLTGSCYLFSQKEEIL